MKEIYTKKLLLLCCLFAFATSVEAQFELSITSPGSAVSSYTLLIGAIGVEPSAGLSDTLYYQAGLACDTMVSPIGRGKIVLIDRGTCSFWIKAKAAELAGAVAVVICNNSAADPINITGGAKLTIPTLMASQADCKKIKLDINGVDAVASINKTGCTTPIVYAPEVFWGQNPGEGDFSNGLVGWTVNPLTDPSHIWVANNFGIPESPSFATSTTYFTSPTACNGVASFSFVKYSLIVNPNPGSPPYPVSSGELISPTIDCSGKEFVAIEFYTFNARLNRQNSFSYSIDDGLTWSEPETITTKNSSTAGYVAELKRFPLPSFANQPKCKFKFIADGDFYQLMIDDVTLLSKKIYSMEISNDYFGMATNFSTPYNQVEPMPFTLDIENLGNAPVDNVKVAVSINKAGENAVIFSDTINYGTVDVGVRDADRIFDLQFTPENKEAEYELYYDIFGDSITSSFEANDFEITNNVFSKMPIDPAVVNGWKLGADNFISGANFYKIVKGTWPDGQAITLDKGRAAAYVNVVDANAPANTTAILSYDVYKWEDTNGDTIISQPNERTLLATGSVIIDDDVDTITIDLADPLDPEKKVVLDPSDNYNLLTVVSISPLDETNTSWFIGSNNPFQGDNAGRYHGYASALAKLNTGTPIWTGSFYGTGTADDIEARELENTTLTIFSPLYFQKVDVVNTQTFDASLKFNAYPSPAIQDLNVDLAFEKSQKYANIFISDMTGRIVHVEKYVNIQNKSINIDVSRFAAGAYSLQVVTDTGFNTQTFSVVK